MVVVIVGPPVFETLSLLELVHPFASVTVTVYVVAERLGAVEAFPPFGDQVYV